MKARAILFDLDGVLVDATELHYESLNEALTINECEPIPREAHEKTFNGLPTNVKLEMLKIPQSIRTKIWMDKQNFTNILIDKMIKTDERKIGLLKRLMDKGYFIACVTNSIRDTAEKMLKNAGLFDYIDLLIAGDEVKNQKPASEGYVTAMIKFESYPRETYIVEDSEYGKLSAYSTGSNVIEVENDSQVTIELFKERGLL